MNHSSVAHWPWKQWVSQYALCGIVAALALTAVLLFCEVGIKLAIVPLASVLAVAMFVRPHVATLFVVFAIYSNTPVVANRFHGVPFMAAAAIPMLLLIPIAYYTFVRRLSYLFSPVIWLIFAFTLIQMAGALTSVQPETAVRAAFTGMLEGIVLYLLIINAVRTPEQLRHVVWVLIVVGAFLGGVGLYQRATGTYGTDYGGYAQIDKQSEEQLARDPSFEPRQAGPIGVENRYAHMMLLLVPLGLLRLRDEERLSLRIAAAGFTALIAIGVALTYSRGALIAFAVMAAAMVLMRLVRWKHAIGITVVVLLIVAMLPAYRERLVRLSGVGGLLSQDVRTTSIASDRAIMGRLNEATTAALVFADHPLVGVGPSMFPFHYERYSAIAGFGQHEGQRMAHNLYLGLAAEHGVLGLGCLLVLFAMTIRDLMRARGKWRKSDPLRASLATSFLLVVFTYMVVGMFMDFSYVRYFWLMMALAAVASREREPAADQNSQGK